MRRGFVNRILLTTLYRDMCSVTSEHPLPLQDHERTAKARTRPTVSASSSRRNDRRTLCYFKEGMHVGFSDGFELFMMPAGTRHEFWRLAVPTQNVSRCHVGHVKSLNNGYIVRYPTDHYAYPIIKRSERDIIETDDIQAELLYALYHELLPEDTVAHWVRMAGGRQIRVKIHGLNSSDRRVSVVKRVVMRDYWNDQYFTTKTDGGMAFLHDFHASTRCRVTTVLKGRLRDVATDGSSKANARARFVGDEWFKCKCGRLGPADVSCEFHERDGHRMPQFSVRCPSCGSDCTPRAFHEMNESIAMYASAYDEYEPFSMKTPSYKVLRTGGDVRFPEMSCG